jgi:hypothetical protein
MEKKTKNGLIVVAIVIAAGFFLLKKFPIKSKPEGSGDGDIGGDNTGGNTGDNTGGNTGATINARSVAEDIFNAMDGYGTDEDAIILAFSKINSDADFDAVNSAFGTRTINSGSGNIFVGDFTGNLSQCLVDELSEYYIDQINSDLINKGITRRISYN